MRTQENSNFFTRYIKAPFYTLALVYLLNNSSDKISSGNVTTLSQPDTPVSTNTEKDGPVPFNPITIQEAQESFDFKRVEVTSIEELSAFLLDGEFIITIPTDTVNSNVLIDFVNQFTDGQIMSNIEPTSEGNHIQLTPLGDQLMNEFKNKLVLAVIDADCLHDVPLTEQQDPIQSYINDGKLITGQYSFIKIGANGPEIPYVLYTRFSPANFEPFRNEMPTLDSTFIEANSGHGVFILNHLAEEMTAKHDLTLFCSRLVWGSTTPDMIQKLYSQDPLALLISRSLLSNSENIAAFSDTIEQIYAQNPNAKIWLLNASGNNYRTTDPFGKNAPYLVGVAGSDRFNTANGSSDKLSDFSNRPYPIANNEIITGTGVAPSYFVATNPNGSQFIFNGTSAAAPNLAQVGIRYLDMLTEEEIAQLGGLTTSQFLEQSLRTVYPDQNIIGEYKNIAGGTIDTTFVLTQEQAQAVKIIFSDLPEGVVIQGATISFLDDQISSNDYGKFGIDIENIPVGPLGTIQAVGSLSSLLDSSINVSITLQTSSGDLTRFLDYYNGSPLADRQIIIDVLRSDSPVRSVPYLNGQVDILQMYSRPEGELPVFLWRNVYLPLIELATQN